MDPEKTPAWLAIMQISEHMHELAVQAQWERVMQHELERRTLIEAFFSDPQTMHAGERMRIAVQALLALDKKIEHLGLAAREQTRSELTQLAEGQRAIDAYSKQQKNK